jgi:hypothetical protein
MQESKQQLYLLSALVLMFSVISNVIIATENHQAESMRTRQMLCSLTWSLFFSRQCWTLSTYKELNNNSK